MAWAYMAASETELIFPDDITNDAVVELRVPSTLGKTVNPKLNTGLPEGM